MRRRTRRHVTLVVLALVAAVGATTAAPPGAAASTNDPVLLVHGWRGSPTTWADMIARFAAKGRKAVAIDLASEDNIRNAAQIRDFIKAKGWRKVDIVAQSMGGLSSRHYIKFLGPTVVDTYVSLATPQYGMITACALWYGSGGQMCPSSRFLRDLNYGDDTPGAVYWTTLYSTTDGVIPTSTSKLDGGACHIQVSRPGHNELDNDAAVFGHVLASVNRQPCTGVMR